MKDILKAASAMGIAIGGAWMFLQGIWALQVFWKNPFLLWDPSLPTFLPVALVVATVIYTIMGAMFVWMGFVLLLGGHLPRPSWNWIRRIGGYEIGRNLSIVCAIGVIAIALVVLATYRFPLGQNGWVPW